MAVREMGPGGRSPEGGPQCPRSRERSFVATKGPGSATTEMRSWPVEEQKPGSETEKQGDKSGDRGLHGKATGKGRSDRTGDDNVREDDEAQDEESAQSFPSSDPPAW